GYGLPASAGREALVVALSYSGDTAEVLSAVDVALGRRSAVVAVTAGGALGALAQARGLPCVTLPAGLMARMAPGYLAVPLLPLVGGCGAPARLAADSAVLPACGAAGASAADIEDALSTVQDQGDDLVPDRPIDKNEAKRLALAIGSRLPAGDGGSLSGASAYRWKHRLERNSAA